MGGAQYIEKCFVYIFYQSSVNCKSESREAIASLAMAVLMALFLASDMLSISSTNLRAYENERCMFFRR